MNGKYLKNNIIYLLIIFTFFLSLTPFYTVKAREALSKENSKKAVKKYAGFKSYELLENDLKTLIKTPEEKK